MSGSKIRLYGSTSGYVELEAPAVAPDGVLTLPTGTGGFGKTLQVVQTVKADTFSTASTTFQDVMNVSITPTSASNKVLVLASIPIGVQAALHAGQMLIRRDATNLLVPTSPGSRTAAPIMAEGFSGNDPLLQVMHFTFLDSPATTSSVSYNVQMRSNTGSGTVYVNRTHTDTDNGNFSRGVATLTAIEVAA